MDSPAPTNPSKFSRLLPLGCLIRFDFQQTLRHWALRTWIGLGILLAGISLFSHSGKEEDLAPVEAPKVMTSQLAHRLLRFHLLLGTSFAVAIGASAICGEADMASDALLTRGVSRWQYLLSKLVARNAAVVLVIIGVVLPTVGIAALCAENDITGYGLFAGLWDVSLVIMGVMTLSVAGSLWFASPLAAVAVVWMIVYGFGLATSILDVKALSPLAWLQQIPYVLKGLEENLPPTHLFAMLFGGAAVAVFVSLVHYCTKDLTA